ncbi:uncharacterized protein [Anoplolepis gracilipes]|uniref:uncharacterized protein n=1 Tax=Anoplolepis gracilipes TaxID=354296 RepID=UPI003BA0C3A5
MRLYAVALITWAATITAFSEPNVANLSDEKAVDYTELRDLPEKQITGFHVTGIEARSSGRTNTGDHPDVGSSGTADEKGWNGVSAGDSSTSEVIYATPLAETIDEYPFKEQSREAVSEDILLVENAGSFGQRVRQDRPNGRTAPGNTRNTVRNTIGDSRKDDEYASTRKSFSSTASPLEDGRPYVSVTSEPYVLALKKESDLADDPPAFSDPEVVKSKASNREEIFNVETVKEPSAPANVASILSENDVVPEDLQTRVRSSRAYNGTEAEASTEKPEESVEKSVVQMSSSTSVEISSSVQPVKFSGPIIVADLVDRATPEMTVDYLDDGDAAALKSVENAEITPGSYVESSRPKAPVLSKGIETSSIMLNPLQVGIALVNAHETGSMVDSEQSAATDTKDYLQDYPQDDLQRLSTGDKKFIENDVENRSRVDYKDESFQREGEKSSVEAVTQKVPDNSVEIQKSVEIYHTAPVHEIHYPPVYIQQTSNLGVIETNNIGRPSQPYGQDEQSESRSNYEVYRGNEQSVDRSVIKTHTSDQKLSRNQYNALEDDDLAKPTASAFIGDEYAPNAVHEQAPVETTVELQPYKYNDVPPVLLLPNQFDDTSYDQSHVRHNFNDNGDALSPHSAKVLTYPGTARQESASETYRPDHQQQQLSQQPTIDHQFRRPEAPQLLLKIIPAGSSSNEGFMVPLPRPYPPIEKIVEKTIHVPHPIEIEKVIEKKVPFPVERVVEKRVQVPVPVAVPHQLYHVHQVQPMVEKQVRLPQVYPVHVERLIEKRLPYVIQRLVVQPTASYPLQLRLSPTEKPATIAARLPPSATVPRPYRTDAERPTDSDKLNDIAVKYRQKLVSSSNPRGGDSAVFESQSETNASKLYGIPPYGRPLTYDYNIDVGKGYVPFTDVKLMILPRKYNSHHVVLRPQAVASSYTTLPFRQHIVYNLVERNKASKDEEYVGPAPPRKISQNKTPTSVAQPSATVAALRRSRQPETQYPGSFRQSKMEYGFKPPMVPSVQYDELTATAVEN